jgi:hypothetical protein
VRLSELDPALLQIDNEGTWKTDVEFEKSDGIIFLCPVCFKANGGRVGTHSVVCWKPHVPQERSPGPGRWNFLGTSLDNITLQAGSSSVFLTTAPCKAHFYIRDGEVIDA